jgi:squalene-associated FAD-dependent desaturase
MVQDALKPDTDVHVAVIGGGCAGLAAATRLVQAGIRATVLEASSHLGGRARGVDWKGLRLDNGQHILLGAYEATLSLLELAGINLSESVLRLPLQLSIRDRFQLKAWQAFPAPLHVLFGLLNAKGLSLKERFAAIQLMAWLNRTQFHLPVDEPLLALLQRKKQPEAVIELLWEPLCLAALNTPLKNASARIFIHVLRDSFSGGRHHSDLLLPRRDLSALLADPLAAYIQRNNGHVLMNTPVTKVIRHNGLFRLTTQEQDMAFSHVVLAVSPFRAAELLADMPGMTQAATACTQLRYQPIYTVYLQYDKTVRLPAVMLGLAAGNHSQWLFDRGQLCEQHGLIAAVISAEGPHQQLTQQELAQAVTTEIAQAFPEFPAPAWHKVIAEKRATFACTSNIARPDQLTGITGLYLAGDYTESDYPATIEGAVRSGEICARHTIQHLPPYGKQIHHA